ncbi:pyrroloquinoline quinone biosynthesis peptide chaperone PqqD [Paraburkholderia sp. GAS334]|uniref:pyrroloquinoline quinone biosynthesis peptide chaperone PqqD n=1 Tax=Paraburkholderia sp. GAS334 TaxID=3035131 RepID=UPI003D1E64EC
MNDTSMSLSESDSESARPTLRALFRLQFEPAQDTFVLLYPEGMVKLNQSAAEIIRRCDGTRELERVVAEVETAFNRFDLSQPITAFLAEATARGWMEWIV